MCNEWRLSSITVSYRIALLPKQSSGLCLFIPPSLLTLNQYFLDLFIYYLLREAFSQSSLAKIANSPYPLLSFILTIAEFVILTY